MIAALAVLAREAAALEAQGLAAGAAGRDGHHHWPFDCGNAHFCAGKGFVERNRHIQPDIVAFPREERAGQDLDRDDGVAEAAGAWLTLAAKAHLLTIDEAGRELQIDGLAVTQRHPLAFPARGFVEWHLERIRHVGTARRWSAARTGTCTAAAHAAAAAEQAFEDVAEIAPFLPALPEALETIVAIAALRPAKTAAPCTAAPCTAAKAERRSGIAITVDLTPIKPGAFVLVGQQVVSAGDFGKAFCRIGFARVAIWVKLLGQRAIGGLDVLFARAARHTEDGIWICHKSQLGLHGVTRKARFAVGVSWFRAMPALGAPVIDPHQRTGCRFRPIGQAYRTASVATQTPDSDAIPDRDPFAIFEAWFAEAQARELNDPNAMALATATPGALPSVRMVLLKGHGPDGFVFYTNFESRKGGELAANPEVALLFHWKSLRRQIRIEGAVTEVTPAEADAYFASRHPQSRLGSAASDQSRPLPSREAYLARVDALSAEYPDGNVPRPAHWSGYRVTPRAIEFWQDRSFRLHERRRFVRPEGGLWSSSLLYP